MCYVMEQFYPRRVILPAPCCSFKHLKTIVLVTSLAAILTHAYFNLHDVFQSRGQLYPMVQFDRSGFTKADILSSSYQAIKFLSKLNQAESGDPINRNITFMKNVLNVDDRKTRRQLLALEALGMSSENDFRVLSSLGYTPSANASSLVSTEYLKFSPEIVGFKHPDYSRLCLDSTFTVANPNRGVDRSFCPRLKRLGRAILEGREPPLLTLFTWWVDPISDGEILSRKAMMANWDALRPFVVPVVFTNSRMNMAYANGHGWPCFPVTETNENGLPLFESLSRLSYQKFASSYYGYAKPIAMFDASLLETLLAIKDSYYRTNRNNFILGKGTPGSQGPQASPSLLIHGRSIKMQHKFPDYFVNPERLHKYLRANLAHRRAFTADDSNYIVFKDIDFTDMPAMVVHDDFLFHFLVDFSLSRGHTVINASSTLLAIQTFRSDHTNEWGRRYLQSKQFDPFYNKRLATVWYDQNRQESLQGRVLQGRSSSER